MSEYRISEKAYAKMMFHVAKYPHLAVNGVLLGTKPSKGSNVEIEDVIPLFHQCLHVSPMAEVALIQIDEYAAQKNLVIAGYYVAHENFYDTSCEKAPGHKIADKIYENNKSACFIVVDNKLVTLNQEEPAIIVHSFNSDSGRWIKANFVLQHSERTLSAVSALLSRGAMRDIVDFDNFLDNPKQNWTNIFLNNGIEKLLAMY